MPTYQTATTLREPSDAEPIDLSTRIYFGGLARHAGHELLLEAFERSGITKAELALRLGYDPSRVGRIINVPSNITLETLGEVLFAIDGSAPVFSQCWPLRQRARNCQTPDWLPAETVAKPTIQASPAGSSRTTDAARFVVEPA